MKNKLFILFLFPQLIFSQESDAYTVWKEKLVIHSGISYRTAPFSIKYNLPNDINRLKYKGNLNTIFNVGFAYKWAALKVGLQLPGYLRNKDNFGETRYFDLNLEFGLKSWYFDFELHTMKGFALVNSTNLDSNLVSEGSANLLYPSTNSSSLSLSSWKFFNKEYKVKPALGIVGRYKKRLLSGYLKTSLNLHGVRNNEALMPFTFIDTLNTIARANGLSSLDIGIVPGIAFVDNLKGWQYGAWFGFGGVVQAKFWSADNSNRGFLGLAPRIDLKLKVGYNVDNYFVMLLADFDNKSIRFNDLKYRQIYYQIGITGGYRFNIKKDNRKK
ncbi:MAG: hypothetical protein ACPGU5_07500 [Lishizhenia sp.]